MYIFFSFIVNIDDFTDYLFHVSFMQSYWLYICCFCFVYHVYSVIRKVAQTEYFLLTFLMVCTMKSHRWCKVVFSLFCGPSMQLIPPSQTSWCRSSFISSRWPSECLSFTSICLSVCPETINELGCLETQSENQWKKH